MNSPHRVVQVECKFNAGRGASVAGEAAPRSEAGHAANAGTNTSGAGGLYPREAWGRIALYNEAC
jgi:hypothetical protein